MLKPNYPLLQSFWVWQGFMDRIAFFFKFFYYSTKYFWAYFDEKARENPRNYGEQVLAYSDIGAEQGGKNN